MCGGRRSVGAGWLGDAAQFTGADGAAPSTKTRAFASWLIGAAAVGYAARAMGRRGLFLLAAAAVVVLGLGFWLSRGGGGSTTSAVAVRPAPPAHGAAAEAPPEPEARQPPAPPPAAPGASDSADAGDAAGGDNEPDELGGDVIAAAWAKVDLEEVRRAMPDNRYWQMSAPTKDEAEIERRERERDRWNEEYGKVLSGTGSEQEIRDYYDERARLSGDYVEFTTYLLDHYGNVLTERDVSLLQLARRLHLARLEEIPRSLETALERKGQQDEARARWQADERAFNADDTAPPPSDDQ